MLHLMLHSKDPKCCLFYRCVIGSAKSKRQYVTRIGGVNHPIIPMTCSRIVRVTLLFVHLKNRRFKYCFVLATPLFTFTIKIITLDGCQYGGRLLSAHHRDTRVWPHP